MKKAKRVYICRIPFVFVLLVLSREVGSATTDSQSTSFPTTPSVTASKPSHQDDLEPFENMPDIRLLLSDVDGTLVHYPDSIISDDDAINRGNRILKLPASATGMQGIISSKTLQMCQELRKGGIKLVLVSGMRTSTLLKRLPFLPKSDAYCSEAGGRIFLLRRNNSDNNNAQLFFTITPESFDGADSSQLKPFVIMEDLNWRQKMTDLKAAGPDGYVGAELDLETSVQEPIPIQDRTGALWEFARQLMAEGYVLDTKGYASCFRVNLKQQTQVSKEDFERLQHGEILRCPSELATSTNLGCIDYYPVESGKRNCCEYLADKLLVGSVQATAGLILSKETFLSRHCICMCDDDNDLEMALACQHAFIPSVSSTSMADVIAKHPHQFSQTGKGHYDHLEGTIATEKALELALQRISSSHGRNKIL